MDFEAVKDVVKGANQIGWSIVDSTRADYPDEETGRSISVLAAKTIGAGKALSDVLKPRLSSNEEVAAAILALDELSFVITATGDAAEELGNTAVSFLQYTQASAIAVAIMYLASDSGLIEFLGLTNKPE